MSYIDFYLDQKHLWKDRDIIKKHIPVGFENFPPDLKDIFISHIQLTINAGELNRELYELKRQIFEKEKLLSSSMKEVKKYSDRIKSYFSKNEELS